jgi:hypothetical protein
MAGALIPSLAVIIFNLLNFVFDNYENIPRPHLPKSVFDISVGCAFAIVGIAVTAKEKELMARLTVGSIIVILAILGVGLILPFFLIIEKGLAIWLVNILSFFVLGWAIVEAE